MSQTRQQAIDVLEAKLKKLRKEQEEEEAAKKKEIAAQKNLEKEKLTETAKNLVDEMSAVTKKYREMLHELKSNYCTEYDALSAEYIKIADRLNELEDEADYKYEFTRWENGKEVDHVTKSGKEVNDEISRYLNSLFGEIW